MPLNRPPLTLPHVPTIRQLPSTIAGHTSHLWSLCTAIYCMYMGVSIDTGPSMLKQTTLHSTKQERAAALGLHFISMKWRFITVPAGRKSHLQRLRHYLVAVTLGAGATQALQIYDLTNKLIGSTLQLPQVCLLRHTDSVAGACRQCAILVSIYIFVYML